jgi:hypothetical protein
MAKLTAHKIIERNAQCAPVIFDFFWISLILHIDLES